VHTRLARGFVTDRRMDGKDRIVTFANGLVAREVIVDIDERARRRLAAGPIGAMMEQGVAAMRKTLGATTQGQSM
jgi:hypothetical protein